MKAWTPSEKYTIRNFNNVAHLSTYEEDPKSWAYATFLSSLFGYKEEIFDDLNLKNFYFHCDSEIQKFFNVFILMMKFYLLALDLNNLLSNFSSHFDNKVSIESMGI